MFTAKWKDMSFKERVVAAATSERGLYLLEDVKTQGVVVSFMVSHEMRAPEMRAPDVVTPGVQSRVNQQVNQLDDVFFVGINLRRLLSLKPEAKRTPHPSGLNIILDLVESLNPSEFMRRLDPKCVPFALTAEELAHTGDTPECVFDVAHALVAAAVAKRLVAKDPVNVTVEAAAGRMLPG